MSGPDQRVLNDRADRAVDALALLDRLGIERAAFCGLSLGGMVGIRPAAHAPERLSSLVLCSISAYTTTMGHGLSERHQFVGWAHPR
ncbi:MAG: alpha/beta fold hydrolase [Pseudonocardiales bacterium]|nr:alpha/beta fold hydrolase [Pseudonocardiales bacterium]